jgi:hypothetical protein
MEEKNRNNGRQKIEKIMSAGVKNNYLQKKDGGLFSRTLGLQRASGAAACYPSTVGSGQ